MTDKKREEESEEDWEVQCKNKNRVHFVEYPSVVHLFAPNGPKPFRLFSQTGLTKLNQTKLKYNIRSKPSKPKYLHV